MKTNGQIGYEAGAASYDVPPANIIPCEKLPPVVQRAHEAAAQAVLDAQPCCHPWAYVRFEFDMRKKCLKCGKEL